MDQSISIHSNIQINNIAQEEGFVSSIADSFPKDATIEVDIINGKKEGKGVVLSKRGVPLAELNFKNNKLEGHCLLLDEYGERMKEINFHNGVAEGWYCEFSNNLISKMGTYKNGMEFSELRKHPQNPDFFEEMVGSRVISICKYSNEYKKDGICTFFDNEKPTSVIRFEEGIEKEKLFEFRNRILLELDKEGQIVYRGEYRGDAIQGFKRYGNGYCYEYMDNKVSRITQIENGVKMGYQLLGDMMKEFDSNNVLKYEGNFEGSIEDGFVRNGEGNEYLSDGLIIHGVYKHGKRVTVAYEVNGKKKTEYDQEKRIVYIGEYSNTYKRSGNGLCFEYDRQYLKEVYTCENGEKCWKALEFDKTEMTEYNQNGEIMYVGGFKGDVKSGFTREGEGQEYDNNILIYIGGWKDGVYEGMGRSYRDRKVYYKGFWKAGKPNGKGELMDGFDIAYQGKWKDGLIEVEKETWFDYESGKMCGLYKNGAKKYMGEMKNCLPDGNGVYYNKKGSIVFEGEWKDGYIQLEKGIGFSYKSGKKCGLYEDGKKKYEGEMKHGIPDGKGVYFDNNGTELYSGYWIDGEIHIQGSEWFCYESETIEVRTSKTVMKRIKDCIMWITSKTGKIVISVVLVMMLLIVMILCIMLNRENGWYFKRGSGFDINNGVLTISGGNNIYGNFQISGYNDVKLILFKNSTLMNLESLEIRDCNVLESIIVENCEGIDSSVALNIKDVNILSNNISLF